MIIHRDFKQGSLEWALAHCGIPTASEFDQIVTPAWKLRDGEMPKSYLNRKLAEWWQGGPLMGSSSWSMDQGTILEGEALLWFEYEYGVGVDRPGFITTDGGMIGCSPDGLIEDGGLELKCPEAHTHVGYLLDGGLPKEYRAQVHGCMFVTGAPWWRFVSYRRHFPPLVLKVERDEEIQKQLAEALSFFMVKMEMGKERMQEIWGGPPPSARAPESITRTRTKDEDDGNWGGRGCAIMTPDPVTAEYRD